MSNPLDRLSELYGILPGYNDIWGNTHRTSDPARRALLKAMDVAADSEEEDRRILAQLSSGADGNSLCPRCRCCAKPNRRRNPAPAISPSRSP